MLYPMEANLFGPKRMVLRAGYLALPCLIYDGQAAWRCYWIYDYVDLGQPAGHDDVVQSPHLGRDS